MSKSTKKNLPYVIKYLQKFNSRREARMLEVTIKNSGVKRWYLKNQFTHEAILAQTELENIALDIHHSKLAV